MTVFPLVEELRRDLHAAVFTRPTDPHHIRELNAIDPFRKKNGRTMRVHLEQLAE